MWWLLLFGSLIVAMLLWRAWRWWGAPWAEIEQLIDDVANVRTPATFLIDGNAYARRAALKLEDIFLRQRALEQRASAGELDVRAILDAIPDGLCVVDETSHIRLLNPAARRIFSISAAAASGSVLETFRDSTTTRLVENALRQGAAAREIIRMRGRDDTMREIAVTALPLASENGSKRGAVVLFEDTTQLHHLEQVRRDFVSNVSHELRTPLSIFRGYLETLIEEPELAADERQRILRVLEKHSVRLNALADDLLSLARLEAPAPDLQFGKLNLREFVQRVAKEWEKKAAARQLHILVNVAEDPPSIQADEARLEEVLYNLLDNAVKYSNPGGLITIAAARERDDRVSISVSDEGAGIAAADLPRIFERFYRADKARSRELGGTGLGLAIVKHIAHLHGGSVEAESQLGRGTTIRLILPIAS